MALVKKKRRRK